MLPFLPCHFVPVLLVVVGDFPSLIFYLIYEDYMKTDIMRCTVGMIVHMLLIHKILRFTFILKRRSTSAILRMLIRLERLSLTSHPSILLWYGKPSGNNYYLSGHFLCLNLI